MSMSLDELIAAAIHEELPQTNGMGAPQSETLLTMLAKLERHHAYPDTNVLFRVSPEEWSTLSHELGSRIIYETGIDRQTAIVIQSSKIKGYVISDDKVSRGEAQAYAMMPILCGKVTF
jgi:hypothetical protein